jgi:hypothetical protein
MRLRESANLRRGARLMTEEMMEEKMRFVESVFEKYGAEPLDINEKNREKFEQRRIFKYKDSYFRVDHLKFEEDDKPYLVLGCTDDEKFAGVGLLEDIDAFSFDLTDEELEQEVRYAFGIDPYPEDYSF